MTLVVTLRKLHPFCPPGMSQTSSKLTPLVLSEDDVTHHTCAGRVLLCILGRLHPFPAPRRVPHPNHGMRQLHHRETPNSGVLFCSILCLYLSPFIPHPRAKGACCLWHDCFFTKPFLMFLPTSIKCFVMALGLDFQYSPEDCPADTSCLGKPAVA